MAVHTPFPLQRLTTHNGGIYIILPGLPASRQVMRCVSAHARGVGAHIMRLIAHGVPTCVRWRHVGNKHVSLPGIRLCYGWGLAQLGVSDALLDIVFVGLATIILAGAEEHTAG